MDNVPQHPNFADRVNFDAAIPVYKADWDALRAENERLRAAVETAAAMVKHADPDLAYALERLLVGRRHIRPT